MLKNWLVLPDTSDFDPVDSGLNTISQGLMKSSLAQRNLRKLQLAILGFDGSLAYQTRKALYELTWGFGGLQLMDLGNMRKSTPEFVTPLLRELSAGNIVPILIGDTGDLFRAQYQAFQSIQSQVSVLMMDQRIALSPEKARVSNGLYLNPAVYNRRHKLYHLSHIGAQRPLIDVRHFDIFEEYHFELLRLGDARNQLAQCEPMLRDADLLGVDLAVMNTSAAPAQHGYNPAGFQLEEAAKLCRYAGMSDKLRSFGLYGFDSQAPLRDQRVTAMTAAQLIWHFCEGFANRYGDYPAVNTGLVEYIVDHPNYQNLTFWKSRRSGRWWVQSPAFDFRGEKRHKLIPCNPEDFEAASRGELPERLIASFSR